MKKHIINFSKYLSIGLFVTLASIFLSWFFIDIIGLKALISSTIIEASSLLAKYISYRKVKLIHKKFTIFLGITLASTISFIVLSSILIDVLKFATLIIIPFLIVLLFMLRFFAFYWTGIIKK